MRYESADPGAAPQGPEPDLESSSKYRPELDGLRTMAVYLVVLFHSGVGQFSGGYIGVDVFFVLSGFLVTQLLLRDIAQHGSVRLPRFYARRFRRLLPAAFVTLAITALVYASLTSPSEAVSAVTSFKAAYLYSANWHFVGESTAYFGADIASSPVLHFWSLAVEEQFYLLWPLLLGGGLAATRRFEPRTQMRTVRIAIGIGALGSLAWALSLQGENPARAYYGTDARAYQLLAGASLALAPAILGRVSQRVRWVRVVTLGCLVALVVLGSSSVGLGAIERGAAATLVTCVLIAALDGPTSGLAKRFLSSRSMTYLGAISYGTYLWHWLVVLVLVTQFDISTTSTLGLTVLIATALASLSYHLLEHPVRASQLLDRYRTPVVVAGLLISIGGALVVVPATVGSAGNRTAGIATSPATGGTPVPAGLDWQAVRREARRAPTCTRRPVDQCVVASGSGPTVELMGDSHAQMLLAPFVEIAERRNWTLIVSIWDACPWQDGLYRFTGTIKASCLAFKEDVQGRVRPALDPDIVILVHAPLDKPGVRGLSLGGPDGPLPLGQPSTELAIERATDLTVARLRGEGRDVVMIEPIPQAPPNLDPIGCISQAAFLDQCRFVAGADPTALELHFREIDKADGQVWALNLDRLACPYLPICDPVVDAKIVWYDLSHLSTAFARSLVDPIDQLLVVNGIG